MGAIPEVNGVLLLGYAKACVNFKYIAPKYFKDILVKVKPEGWYSFEYMQEFEKVIKFVYNDPCPIFERIGEEMTYIWYNDGLNPEKINSGVEFLEIQKDSKSYHSVVRGDLDIVGGFYLDILDKEKGYAEITSTTYSPVSLEKGIIKDGMKVMGDITEVEVEIDNNFDGKRFIINFK